MAIALDVEETEFSEVIRGLDLRIKAFNEAADRLNAVYGANSDMTRQCWTDSERVAGLVRKLEEQRRRQ